MPNTPDERRLKDLLKEAIVEVFEERRDLLPQTSSNAPQLISSPVIRNVLLWIVLLLGSVLLYQIVQHPSVR